MPVPGTCQAGHGQMDLEASSDSLLSFKTDTVLRQDRRLKEVGWAGTRSGPHFFRQHPRAFGALCVCQQQQQQAAPSSSCASCR